MPDTTRDIISPMARLYRRSLLRLSAIMFTIKVERDGTVTIADIPCLAVRKEKTRAGETVTYICRRPAGHLPSLWHKDTDARAIWYY